MQLSSAPPNRAALNENNTSLVQCFVCVSKILKSKWICHICGKWFTFLTAFLCFVMCIVSLALDFSATWLATDMACWRTKCRRPWTPDLLEVNSMKQSNIEIFDRNGRLSTKLPRSLSEVTCRLFSPIRSQLLDMKGRQASEKFFTSNLNLRPPLQSAEGSSHAWECAAKSAGCVFWAADRESRWRNADHGNAASSSYEI